MPDHNHATDSAELDSEKTARTGCPESDTTASGRAFLVGPVSGINGEFAGLQLPRTSGASQLGRADCRGRAWDYPSSTRYRLDPDSRHAGERHC